MEKETTDSVQTNSSVNADNTPQNILNKSLTPTNTYWKIIANWTGLTGGIIGIISFYLSLQTHCDIKQDKKNAQKLRQAQSLCNTAGYDTNQYKKAYDLFIESGYEEIGAETFQHKINDIGDTNFFLSRWFSKKKKELIDKNTEK